MGTGDAPATRPRLEDAPQHHRPHLGGQYRISLFGLLGCDRARHAAACRQEAQAAAPEVKAPTRLPHRSPITGALNSFDADGLSPAHYRPAAVATRRPSLDDEPELAHSQWLADLAESYGCQYDEEAAAYARSFAGVGMVEHMMAMEG